MLFPSKDNSSSSSNNNNHNSNNYEPSHHTMCQLLFWQLGISKFFNPYNNTMCLVMLFPLTGKENETLKRWSNVLKVTDLVKLPTVIQAKIQVPGSVLLSISLI